MTTIGPTYDDLQRCLVGIADDPAAVGALVLDGLFAIREGEVSTRGFGDVILRVESQLTPGKLQGIVNALLEYEITYPLHHSVLDAICAILQNRIIDDGETDARWIPKGFELLARTFAWRRLKALLELALGPFDIAERYTDPYTELVLTYLDIAARSDENFEYFARELAVRFEVKKESRVDGPEHVRRYLGRITERLRGACSGEAQSGQKDSAGGAIASVSTNDSPKACAEVINFESRTVEADGGSQERRSVARAVERDQSMGEKIRGFLEEFYLAKQRQNVETKDKSYQETFDGSSKGKDALEFITAQTKGRLDIKTLAYVSIGGADGTEIEYAMKNSELGHGLLIEFSDFGAAEARKISQAMESEGKKLVVFQGDAMQRLRDCSEKLAEWASSGAVKGVVLSMHSVLHELPTRSPRYDPNVLIARIFEPFAVRLFYCREPAIPKEWPETVMLRIADVKTDVLYGIAELVNRTLAFGQEVQKLADGFVQMSSALAVEVMFKVIYSVNVERFRYEMEERVTSFDPDTFVSVLGNYIKPPENIESTPLVTETFRSLYKAAGVEVKTPKGKVLQIPHAFVRVMGAQLL